MDGWKQERSATYWSDKLSFAEHITRHFMTLVPVPVPVSYNKRYSLSEQQRCKRSGNYKRLCVLFYSQKAQRMRYPFQFHIYRFTYVTLYFRIWIRYVNVVFCEHPPVGSMQQCTLLKFTLCYYFLVYYYIYFT